MEAAEHRPTTLAGRDCGQIPIRWGSRALRYTFPLIAFAWRHVLTRRTPLGRHEMSEVRHHGGLADRIEQARGVQPPVPCHNDLLNANFITDGERIWIVDWEYAGMGDRFFDLSNFSVNHDLSADENEEFLRMYFGEVSEDDVRSLTLMRFMSDFREAMWGVVQQGISELDFDFADYAESHFERLRATAADPAFREALG